MKKENAAGLPVLISFSSTTLASSAGRALRAAGYGARVVRLDAAKTAKGCGWGVKTSATGAAAERILHDAGIAYSAVYRSAD